MGRVRGCRNGRVNEQTIGSRIEALAKQLYRSPFTLLGIRYGNFRGAQEVREAMRQAGLLLEQFPRGGGEQGG